MRHLSSLASLLILLGFLVPAGADSADPEDELRKAASRGDLTTVSRLIDEGIDVNAASRHGATALSYAADKGHVEIVELLLGHGAKANVKDTFYEATPITWAAYNGRVAVVKVLLEHGAEPGPALVMAINRDQVETAAALVGSGKLSAETLSSGLVLARQSNKPEIATLLEAAGAKEPEPANAEVERAVLEGYVGRYSSPQGMHLAITLNEEATLEAAFMEQPALALGAIDETTFRPPAFAGLTLRFVVEEGRVTGLVADQVGTKITFEKEQVEATEEAEPADGSQEDGQQDNESEEDGR